MQISLVVLKADKGSNTVILMKTDKITDLLGINTYKILNIDSTNKLTNVTYKIIKPSALPDNIKNSLIPIDCKVPKFYCLPNIHK